MASESTFSRQQRRGSEREERRHNSGNGLFKSLACVFHLEREEGDLRLRLEGGQLVYDGLELIQVLFLLLVDRLVVRRGSILASFASKIRE